MLKKILSSSILNSWFSASVILLSSLIAIPIVITKLSPEEINVWFLFSSIIALSQGVQFGFNTTFSRFISYANNGVRIEEFQDLRFKKDIKFEKQMDNKEFSKIFYLMKNVYIFLSIIYILVLLLIGYFSLIKPIEALATPTDGWIAAGIVAVSSTLTLTFGYYQNFMLGINKVSLLHRIRGIVHLIGLFFIIGIVLLYPTLISIILIYQIVALSGTMVIVYFAKKEFAKMKIEKMKNSFDKEVFSVVWESAWKSGITTIIANVVKHISAILVAQWFSPAVSASFLFTKKLFDILENFTMITFQARLPMIARYRGQGDFKTLFPFLMQTQYVSYGVFLFGYIVLLIGGEQIMSLISSNVNLGSYTLIILFSFTTFFSRWGGMTLAISSQSNHVLEHKSAIVYFIIYLISLSVLMLDTMKIEFFLYALLLAAISSILVVVKTSYATIHTTFWNFEKKVSIPILGLLLLINLIYYWSNT